MRKLLTVVVALAGTALPGLVLTGTAHGEAALTSLSEPEPVLTFVSTPDLFNSDVGDVRLKRRGRGWERGDPNSWNADYAASVDKVFGTIASHDPDAVLVAGDLVEGHWGIDKDGTGIFGPVRTRKQRLRAVTNAGNFYYGQWKSFFRRVGVSPGHVYPAVGDHEIGDNPWPPEFFKYRAFPTFKRVWARNFTTNWGRGHRFGMRPRRSAWEDSAYARWLAPGVLLVTVDVFRRTRGGVVASVTHGQLRWFKRLLGRVSPEATVIVQGHTPALGPVRSWGSSRLFLERGADNPFWRFMNTSGKVDFYFAGEVHRQTVRQSEVGSTVQVTHGGLFAGNGTNYLVGRVFPEGRTTLESYNFPTARGAPGGRLWQTSMKRPRQQLGYGDAVNSGGLTLVNGEVVSSWGDLALNPVL